MGEGSHKYGVARRSTEKGYTNTMTRNIVGMENSIRRNPDESLHIFTSTGKKIKSIGGKGAQVSIVGHTIPKDSILTHNHPRSLGKKGISAIGNSFSVNDIAIAINNNAKEVRAVTPTYTFSMKRPKGGWKISVEDLAKQYNDLNKRTISDGYSYIGKNKDKATAAERASVVHYHKIWKGLAKKNGWDYSKTRG